jgi:two-component system, OmpR family, KDP operon response regulator KdpE
VKILVVDADPPSRARLIEELPRYWNATQVLLAATGKLGLRLLIAHQPDVVLLATDLVDRPALAVLSKIRHLSETPVLLLARSPVDAEQIRGLRLGADDYLVEPVSTAVLAARIDAVRRRGGLGLPSDSPPDFQTGALAVWYGRRLVTVRGAPVKLTPLEYRLLHQLVRHVGEVVPSPVLLDRVWGEGYGATTKYLKVFINRLRSKLGRGEDLPSIETERRVGYRLVGAERSRTRHVA